MKFIIYLFSAVLGTVPVTTGLQSALEQAVGNVPAQSIATFARPDLTHTNTHSILFSKLQAQASRLKNAPVQHYAARKAPLPSRLRTAVKDNLANPVMTQAHPQSVVPRIDISRLTAKKRMTSVFRKLPLRYPGLADTSTQRLLVDRKRAQGVDLSLKEVIDDIQRQSHEIDLGLRDRITGELIPRQRLPKPVLEAFDNRNDAREHRLDYELEIFGRFLSPEEFQSVKAIFEKEFTEDSSFAELQLIKSQREELLTSLANRRVSSEETFELALRVAAEDIAEAQLNLANHGITAPTRAMQ